MNPKRPSLGRGLAALIPSAAVDTAVPQVMECAIDRIETTVQPRTRFEPSALQTLSDSIRESGILQPILVNRVGDRYRVIAGERRLRAARMAGLKTVPVIVRQAAPDEAFVLALVENLQREDLNPVEQAGAFRRLIEEHHLTQEEVAARVGRSRPAVANSLRLLNLSAPVLAALEEGRIPEGMARALLPLDTDEQQTLLARIEEGRLNVREVESIVRTLRRPPRDPQRTEPALGAYFASARDEIASATGQPVVIRFRGNSGRISLSFASLSEFRRLRNRLVESFQGGSGEAEKDEPEPQQHKRSR